MTETTKDLIARLMQHVEDTMCEAEVDYPAGSEAGARVSYDSDSLQTYFETELASALAREAALREALLDAAKLAKAHGANLFAHPSMVAWCHQVVAKICAALEVKS